MLFLENKILFFFIIFFTLYIIIFIISKIECKQYKINTFNVLNKKNDDKLSIIFITDFHNKLFKNGYDDLINLILSTNPDYIVLGGDFVDFSTFQCKLNNVKYKNSIFFLEKLSKKCKEIEKHKNYNLKRIFFGFGNHELRLKCRIDNNSLVNIYNEFIECLKHNDIEILEDNTYKLSQGITLSGLNLYEGYYNNLLKNRLLYKNIDYKIIDNSFHNIKNNDFNIMVFHKPDYCEDFINYGFDLVLSGHNHGGLINFPIIGSVFSPDFKLFPKYNHGHYMYKDKNIIVSSGIGEHFIKIRVNNIPEICLININ